ncbi:MAG: EAL domain-containing protein [Clostridia bacterium]|nr:EAL domain-containing protein [Clostridia bacterium]
MSGKKGFFKNAVSDVGRVGIILVLIMLASYLVSILNASTAFYTDSSVRSAKLYFAEDMQKVNELAEQHYDNLYEVVDRIEYAASKADVDEIIRSYQRDEVEQFGDLRYYSQGIVYAASGAPIVPEEDTADGDKLIAAIVDGKDRACTSVYYDGYVNKSCIAFFVPVRGSQYVDGLLSIVEARNIVSVDGLINEKACVTAVISGDGMVLASDVIDDFPVTVGNKYYDFIHKFTSSQEMTESVKSSVSKRELSTAEVSYLGTRYTIVSEPIDSFDEKLTLVVMSMSEGLIAPEMTYIRHIVNVLLITVVAFIVGLVYAFLFRKQAKEAISTANLTDPILECPNVEQFRRRAMNLVYAGKHRYAVAVFVARQFHYIDEKFGTEKATEIMKFVARVIETFCDERETYGYAGEGKFIVLVDYAGDSSFRDKIRLFENVINKYDVLAENKAKLKFDVGVYLAFEGKRRTIPEMIECAATASTYARSDVKVPYVIYTDTVRDEINRAEKIETQMESALENGEFRLFLQPKYNVTWDRIDSAEALVRWFDTRSGEYIFPGEFISLFEANGFITKVDHFIYLEVLEYLSGAVERGDKVVPISVNVSRVTAKSPDFIDFYVGNKKKYQIGDGFITFEFTESFAMDDYENLSKIVKALQSNGIRCSIDDFGAGYSSFSILKEIPMDELKLDRLFLSPGIEAERDKKILDSIVALAKEIGMNIVQEGVENEEMFKSVAAMGIDIVQGYHYAKALPLEEYRIFVNSNTSIKYKSKVK